MNVAYSLSLARAIDFCFLRLAESWRDRSTDDTTLTETHTHSLLVLKR